MYPEPAPRGPGNGRADIFETVAAGAPSKTACAIQKVYYTSDVRFTWDPRKAAVNLRKHGVSFEEAASVFADPLALAVEDGVDPERVLLIGLSDRRRLVLSVYTEVDEDTIRIISARRATSHERRHHEEGT